MPTILITGTNRGIGLELTQQYAADGWRIYACCRNPETADALNALAAESDGKVTVHKLDTCNDEQRRALAAELAGIPIDILFNNAGMYGNWDYQSFGSSDRNEWLNTLDANVIAPMQMMETFADNVAASEQKLIANMSSKMGSMQDNGSGGSYIYRSSKAALNAVCVSAAKNLAPRGIKVAVLHPGWVRTDMGGENGELSVEESASALRRNLASMTDEDSGRFMDIDGSTIPW
jgi:NAD(P)-dependent dehydrogenase (short-subunit alcohol dehydrogenase family)